jgi:thiol-disulfide isomerase/thioredoxin
MAFPSQKIIFRGLLQFGVVLVLFTADLPRKMLGGVQQALLATGLWKPAINLPPARPGEPAPYPYHAALTSLTGQSADLHDFRGKVVFLNLWASWCPPCRGEMPDIQRLYEQIDTSRVAFVMLSLDRDPARAREVVREEGYTFPVFFPAGPLPDELESRAIPTTFVLSPAGQIASRTDGMAQYNTAEFRAYLSKLAQPPPALTRR